MAGHVLLVGLSVGALAAFPLGPVGMICVQRTLVEGARAGVASAAGIALAASMWCLAAVHGLGAIAKHLPMGRAGWDLGLGILLVVVASRNLLTPPGAPQRAVAGRALAGHFLSTWVVVVSNPLTLVTVVALLAGLGFGQVHLSAREAAVLALAVFVGGLALWVGLAGLLKALRARLGEGATWRVSRGLSGCALALGSSYVFAAVLAWL